MSGRKFRAQAWQAAKPKGLLVRFAWGLAFLCALLGFSPLTQFADSQLARPLEFYVRDRLGKTPALDPRLKVYSFDSTTVAYLGYTDLSLDTWYHVIEHFAQRKPKAILIDKIFSYPSSSTLSMEGVREEAERFVAKIKQLPTQVYVGGVVSASQVVGRKSLSLQHDDYYYPSVETETPGLALKGELWPPLDTGYFYGPYSWLRPAFRVGHIVYKGQGRIKPFYRLEPKSFVPHISLLSMGRMQLKDQQVFLDQQRIPLNAEGDVVLNFLDQKDYFKSTVSLRSALQRIVRGEPETKVGPEDWVVLLPAMFSGNTDFKETPVGTLQGGYLIVTLMNSILNHKWLSSSTLWDSLFLLIGIGLNTWIALYWAPWIYFCFMGIWALLGPALGLGLFVQEGFCLAWLSATILSLVPGLVIGLERLRQESAHVSGLLMSLRGALAPEIAESIIKDPSLLEGEPREQIVTVMFIDIVGFSMTTERQTPREAFTQLRSQLAEIIEHIHAYQGVVDKSLGDGVLAYFGYQYGETGLERGHADRAVQCAQAIQEAALARAQAAMQNKQPVYPLRIGLNTATVYLGNLGTDGRIDFTLIGNGVNLSSRFEHACKPFRVMMGLSTFDLLAQFSQQDPRFLQREIQIKHHKQPITCIEFHPLEAKEDQLKQVFRYYKNFHRIVSDEQRWTIPATLVIDVRWEGGEARLLNFSQGGLGFESMQELKLDQMMSIQLFSSEFEFQSATISLMPCWQKKSVHGALIYGCAFVKTSDDQTNRLLNDLRDLVRKAGGQETLIERGLHSKVAG